MTGLESPAPHQTLLLTRPAGGSGAARVVPTITTVSILLAVVVAGCAPKRVAVANGHRHAGGGRDVHSCGGAWPLCGVAYPHRRNRPVGTGGRTAHPRAAHCGAGRARRDPARGDGSVRPARVHSCVRRRGHHTAAPPRRSRAQGRAAGGDPRSVGRDPRDACRTAPPAGGMSGRRRRRTRRACDRRGLGARPRRRSGHRLPAARARPLASRGSARSGARRGAWPRGSLTAGVCAAQQPQREHDPDVRPHAAVVSGRGGRRSTG